MAERALLLAEIQKMDVRVLYRISMEADSRISTAAAAECVSLAGDPDALRFAMVEALEAEDLAELAGAVSKVDAQVMAKAISDMVASVEAGVTTKNA